MKNKQGALTIVNNLISIAALADEEHKKKSIQEGKAVRAIGESMMLFHLKVLRDLVDQEKESNE
jgi:hypothetical protein